MVNDLSGFGRNYFEHLFGCKGKIFNTKNKTQNKENLTSD